MSDKTFSERLDEIAIDLALVEPASMREIIAVTNKAANEIGRIARELEPFWLEEREGQFPTPRQALALGRFMGQVMRDDQRQAHPTWSWANVSRGGAGLSDEYLLVRLGDGYEGGIDREGRVST